MPEIGEVIVGLDIGTTKVAVIIGEVTARGVDIIGVGTSPSRGLRQGVVVNIEATTNSIAAAVAEAEQMADSLDWVTGDAMKLPFKDNTFDVYTISFGIRNVTRPQEALAEAFRVLKPGGRLMILEFSKIPTPALQWAYDRYSFNLIPAMGQLIANDRDSYQYLVESIRRFPDQETFLGMVREAGFEQTKYRNLTMGIAALHSGWKI